VESVGSLFPFEEVTVSAEVEGRVDRVLVDIGDRVTRGQPLVQVSPVELQLVRAQQQAALEQTQARLGFTAGGEAGGGPREAAEVKRAAADLKDAEQKYLRARCLLPTLLVTPVAYSLLAEMGRKGLAATVAPLWDRMRLARARLRT
jgi:multidrug efflux pump subunit AcrA (membrane-fusion protein)